MSDPDFKPEFCVDAVVLEEIVEALAERFDTVQIFVTRYDAETGSTLAGEWASGNYYARRGQVAEWLTSEPPDNVVRPLNGESDVD